MSGYSFARNAGLRIKRRKKLAPTARRGDNQPIFAQELKAYLQTDKWRLRKLKFLQEHSWCSQCNSTDQTQLKVYVAPFTGQKLYRGGNRGIRTICDGCANKIIGEGFKLLS